MQPNLTQRLHAKLLLDLPDDFDTGRLIPAFHHLIQRQALPDLLLDVVDYRHVPQGPGVLLVAHEGDFRFDATDGLPGLLYARKREDEGPFEERLRRVLARPLEAALALAEEIPELTPAGDRWIVRLGDRLLAPNNRDTLQAMAPVVRRLLVDLYGEDHGNAAEIRWEDDPRSFFGLRVEAPVPLTPERFLEGLRTVPIPAFATA